MNIMFRNFKVLTLLIIIILTGCKKNKEIPAPEGILSGLVTDANSGTALEGVTIIVFDANNNLPVGSTLVTDATGNYSVTLTPGTYYIKAYSQGYQQVPPKGITPLSFAVTDGQTTDNPFSMFPSSVANGGYISGNVGQGGVLVIANDGVNGYSTISDENGNYTIYNVPAGTYTVNGYTSGYNGTEVTNTLVDINTETPNIDIVMTAGATGSVSGQVTFLATGNIEVDVALIDVYTKEVIPGLFTQTISQQYTINNVPNGNFIARATFANDDRVVDPDWIVKFGEPTVSVAANNVSLDFSCTNSVKLVAPTNAATSVQPIEITTTTPTFEWTAYAATSDYVIEVSDASGNVIWGGFGFDAVNQVPTKNVIIPSSSTSVVFGDVSVGTAPTAQLEVGKIYRWRIYASKDAQNAAGWSLISASEDQRGLIKIIQ